MPFPGRKIPAFGEIVIRVGEGGGFNTGPATPGRPPTADESEAAEQQRHPRSGRRTKKEPTQQNPS